LFENNCQNFVKYLVEAIIGPETLCPQTIQMVLARIFEPTIHPKRTLPGTYPVSLVSSTENFTFITASDNSWHSCHSFAATSASPRTFLSAFEADHASNWSENSHEGFLENHKTEEVSVEISKLATESPPDSPLIRLVDVATALLATSESLKKLFEMQNNTFTNLRDQLFRHTLLFGGRDYLGDCITLAFNFSHICDAAHQVSIFRSQQLLPGLLHYCHKFEARALKLGVMCSRLADEIVKIKKDALEVQLENLKRDRGKSLLSRVIGKNDKCQGMRPDFGILESSFSNFEKLLSAMGDFIRLIRYTTKWFINLEGSYGSALIRSSQLDFQYLEILGTDRIAIAEECLLLKKYYTSFTRILWSIERRFDEESK
jgi:hypothetical protein